MKKLLVLSLMSVGCGGIIDGLTAGNDFRSAVQEASAIANPINGVDPSQVYQSERAGGSSSYALSSRTPEELCFRNEARTEVTNPQIPPSFDGVVLVVSDDAGQVPYDNAPLTGEPYQWNQNVRTSPPTRTNVLSIDHTPGGINRSGAFYHHRSATVEVCYPSSLITEASQYLALYTASDFGRIILLRISGDVSTGSPTTATATTSSATPVATVSTPTLYSCVNEADHACREYEGPNASQVDGFSYGCTAQGGTWHTEGCAAEGRLGLCSDTALGVARRTYYYNRASARSAQRSFCTDGTWSVP